MRGSGLFHPGGFSLQNRFRLFSVYKSNIASKVKIPHLFGLICFNTCFWPIVSKRPRDTDLPCSEH